MRVAVSPVTSRTGLPEAAKLGPGPEIYPTAAAAAAQIELVTKAFKIGTAPVTAVHWAVPNRALEHPQRAAVECRARAVLERREAPHSEAVVVAAGADAVRSVRILC